MDPSALSPPELCGQLLVVGFDGEALPDELARALARGERAGVILFRRNLRSLEQVVQLTSAIHEASGALAPVVGVDQEGGRVTRLPLPALRLPPMRLLGSLDDPSLTEAAGEATGRELAALGFTLDFAPVLDVDSNPANPVIGDRAFGADPERVARHGLCFARGLAVSGVASCGKHFPGHGDTAQDSHVELAHVDHKLERLRSLELVPFRAACRAGIPALMSAHVVVRSVDAEAPATLSARLVGTLLREELGFGGVLFSDDLEMGAIASTGTIGQAAVRAVRAGCDALLVCRSLALADEAHEALVREAERDQSFVRRCREAAARVAALRARATSWSALAGAAEAPAGREQRVASARALVGGDGSQAFGARLGDACRRAGLAVPALGGVSCS